MNTIDRLAHIAFATLTMGAVVVTGSSHAQSMPPDTGMRIGSTSQLGSTTQTTGSFGQTNDALGANASTLPRLTVTTTPGIAPLSPTAGLGASTAGVNASTLPTLDAFSTLGFRFPSIVGSDTIGTPTQPTIGTPTQPTIGTPTQPSIGTPTVPTIGTPTSASIGTSTLPTIGTSSITAPSMRVPTTPSIGQSTLGSRLSSPTLGGAAAPSSAAGFGGGVPADSFCLPQDFTCGN